MMNTKEYFEKLEARIEGGWLNPKDAMQLLKWYAYSCAKNARDQKLKKKRSEQEIARDSAYSYCQSISAVMHLLHSLGFATEKEADEMEDKFLAYIWMNKIR